MGQQGELLAREIYKKNGHEIIAANFFNKKGKQFGEIDFIAKNKEKIIFVEVKTRKSNYSRFGTAVESVNVFKQQKILKAAKIFLQKNTQYQQLKPQIDVCLIIGDPLDKTNVSVRIIANAVEDWNEI